jgi:hypothetical protein
LQVIRPRAAQFRALLGEHPAYFVVRLVLLAGASIEALAEQTVVPVAAGVLPKHWIISPAGKPPLLPSRRPTKLRTMGSGEQ